GVRRPRSGRAVVGRSCAVPPAGGERPDHGDVHAAVGFAVFESGAAVREQREASAEVGQADAVGIVGGGLQPAAGVDDLDDEGALVDAGVHADFEDAGAGAAAVFAGV